MSVAALEAMAAGLPLVVTRTGGTEELVEEGVNGYSFEWGDIEALNNFLRIFAEDRVLARRMGAASHARAAWFGWVRSLIVFSKCSSKLFLNLRPYLQTWKPSQNDT